MLWFGPQRNAGAFCAIEFKNILCYGSADKEPYCFSFANPFKNILCYGSARMAITLTDLEDHLKTSYVMVRLANELRQMGAKLI